LYDGIERAFAPILAGISLLWRAMRFRKGVQAPDSVACRSRPGPGRVLSGRRGEQAAASSKEAPVRPIGLPEKYLAFARTRVKPARQQGEVFG